MVSELHLHGGDAAACGFSPYSFPHAENLWQTWSLQGEPKGLVRGWLGHERWRHKFKLFWSKGSTVLFRDQQQPQKIELQWCLLAVNRKNQVTCHACCTALCGILWHPGGIDLSHWGFFFEKSQVSERNSVILEGVEGDEWGYENLLASSKFLSYHQCILIP